MQRVYVKTAGTQALVEIFSRLVAMCSFAARKPCAGLFARVLLFLLLTKGAECPPTAFAADLNQPGPSAGPLNSRGKSFQAVTGEFLLKFEPEMDHIAITRRDVPAAREHLALRPGGGDPDLGVFAPGNLKRVVCREDKEGVNIELKGSLDWCKYQITLLLPRVTAGLVNSRLEIELTRDIAARRRLFAERHSELAVAGQVSEISQIAFQWIYYLNSTPGAEPYHAVSLNSGAIPDLNQLIYVGDPKILNATLLYYEDFTSLNPFFQATGTRIRDSVCQPPGCLNRPLTRYMAEPADFGFDIPTVQAPVSKGTRLLVANSFLCLVPGAPDIHQTTNYCERFVESVAAIYPHLAKPAPKFVDWPSITERGFDDLAACQKEIHRAVIAPQTSLNSCRRYADCFGSQRAKKMVEKGDTLWTSMRMELPYGDAWQYLFPLAMAGDYALEFGSEAAKRVALDAAADVIKVGRAVKYVFPLRINADCSKPEGIRYEYDCTGAYVYLMLVYHRLTGKPEYITEARVAADRLLEMGFEFPYEFTTTSLAPIGLLRLYKVTGDRRYLDGIAIPMAAILRHSWLFNPDYGAYRGRTIFLLTEGMPGVYANGWEEATMLRYLGDLLAEGADLLPAPIREMTVELLRWKGVSLADSLAPLLPDPSIIYTGTPREWQIPVNRAWHIPLEGFGYLEWDDSGLHNKPGRVSQGPYCFGALPEAALLLFHPLEDKTCLYVETPIRLERTSPRLFTFKAIAGHQPFRAALQGEASRLAGITVEGRQNGGTGPASRVSFKKEVSDGRLWFTVGPGIKYTVNLGAPVLVKAPSRNNPDQ